MANVAELGRINEWLRRTLSSDVRLNQLVAGRIYADEAPQNSAAPMVIFAFLGGSDKLLTARARQSNAIYLIRGIAEGSSYDPVEPVADRIEAVLPIPDEGVVLRDVRIMSCQREQPFQRKDDQYGRPMVYMGGFYRIRFQPVT